MPSGCGRRCATLSRWTGSLWCPGLRGTTQLQQFVCSLLEQPAARPRSAPARARPGGELSADCQTALGSASRRRKGSGPTYGSTGCGRRQSCNQPCVLVCVALQGVGVRSAQQSGQLSEKRHHDGPWQPHQALALGQLALREGGRVGSFVKRATHPSYAQDVSNLSWGQHDRRATLYTVFSASVAVCAARRPRETWWWASDSGGSNAHRYDVLQDSEHAFPSNSSWNWGCEFRWVRDELPRCRAGQVWQLRSPLRSRDDVVLALSSGPVCTSNKSCARLVRWCRTSRRQHHIAPSP